MAKRIRDSLTTKVFLWIFLLLVICSLLIYGCVMVFVPKRYTAMSRSSAVDKTIQLGDDLSTAAHEDIPKEIERFCLENQIVIEVNNGRETKICGSLDGLDVDWDDNTSFVLSINIPNMEVLYTLRLIAWASPEQKLTEVFVQILPFVLLLILFISTVSALLCSKVLVRPILKLSSISQRMADLDLTCNSTTDRTDEIGVLSNNLSAMARKLDGALKDLESANGQLREDMAHIAALSEQRRDFFAAASHELKTPITILKGQIESMILGIGRFKDTKQVLPDTLKEVENMEHLVKEILTISKIEMEGLSEKQESVSLSDALEKVTALLEPLAEEKQIAITKSITPGVMVQGNPSLLEKALHNILSNAIRHSPDRAQVSVRLQEDCLEVYNSGVTIPEEDIPSLFTPFYRVEKSRNKATGGSGLGLYLVKTILQLHELPNNLENRDDGVCFTVHLNQN